LAKEDSAIQQIKTEDSTVLGKILVQTLTKLINNKIFKEVRYKAQAIRQLDKEETVSIMGSSMSQPIIVFITLLRGFEGSQAKDLLISLKIITTQIHQKSL
jgi:hypothetical protein